MLRTSFTLKAVAHLQAGRQDGGMAAALVRHINAGKMIKTRYIQLLQVPDKCANIVPFADVIHDQVAFR